MAIWSKKLKLETEEPPGAMSSVTGFFLTIGLGLGLGGFIMGVSIAEIEEVASALSPIVAPFAGDVNWFIDEATLEGPASAFIVEKADICVYDVASIVFARHRGQKHAYSQWLGVTHHGALVARARRISDSTSGLLGPYRAARLRFRCRRHNHPAALSCAPLLYLRGRRRRRWN